MDAFKLNLYEARVYLSLLRGPMETKEIANVSKVPLPRTYDTLSSLESKGFVERKSDSFSAISPRDALDGRKTQFELAFRKEQEEREGVLGNLLRVLEPAFKTAPQSKDEVTLLHGINAIASKFRGFLTESNDILLVVKHAVEAKEFFLQSLESIERHSKKIRVLVSKDAPLGKQERLLIERLGLQVREAEGIFFDLMVAGDDTVMIGVPDPFSKEPFHSLAVVIMSKSFNRSLRESIQPFWGEKRIDKSDEKTIHRS